MIRRIRFQTKIAKRLAALNKAMHTIIFLEDAIKLYSKRFSIDSLEAKAQGKILYKSIHDDEPVMMRCMFYAIIITYGRLFSSSKGGMLLDDSIFKHDQKLLEQHKNFYETLRHNLVAHNGNNDLESFEVDIVLLPNMNLVLHEGKDDRFIFGGEDIELDKIMPLIEIIKETISKKIELASEAAYKQIEFIASKKNSHYFIEKHKKKVAIDDIEIEQIMRSMLNS